MSTSHDVRRAEDRLVTVISGWLARHVSDRELALELRLVRPAQLDPERFAAIDELRGELERSPERAELEMVARETLETLALGG
jgi:hypothetical protein